MVHKLKKLLLLPFLLSACSTITPRPEPGNAQAYISKADKELNNPSIQLCPQDAVQSVARAKTEIAAAQKELDKLKDEITTLQNRAEQAEKLEKEILKKDKRIWQLWAVLIGTGSMVGLWILMKLGLFAAKFRPFFLL
jgi:hypothetical protein